MGSMGSTIGGWMVLNTDGAAKGNPGPTGAGGVLQGDAGEWVTRFSEYLGQLFVCEGRD